MDVSLAKDLYQTELAKKEQLTASLTLPVGILTVVGGLLGSIIRDYSFVNQVSTIVFVNALLVAVAAFIIALVIIMRVYLGYTYSYVPTSRALLEHYRTVLDFYGERGIDAVNSKRTFNEYIMEKFVEANDDNEIINREKAYNLRRARLSLIVMVLASLVCSVLYLADHHSISNGNGGSRSKKTVNTGIIHNVPSSETTHWTTSDTANAAVAPDAAASSRAANSQDTGK